MIDFTCNICGTANLCEAAQLGREVPSCARCGSSVRTRSLIDLLANELFGLSLALPDFPRVKSLRGLGLSDPAQLADGLGQKFDYRNTFYERSPRLDLTSVPEHEFGQYDFVICSEVLEHVPAPVEQSFENLARLLRPGGVALITVPYSLDEATREHFPDLGRWGLAEIEGRPHLVNRAADGTLTAFDHLVFHLSGREPALELREYAESDLRRLLAGAGFSEVRFYARNQAQYGILNAETWSLPLAARRGEFAFRVEAARDVVAEWGAYKRRFDEEMRRMDRSLWLRVGRRLGLL